MNIGPGLTESYPILTLPRIYDLSLSEKVVIPPLESPDSSIIDLGISKSIISSYIIRPTPKLLWSFALSPTSIVNCMDVLQLKDSKIYAVGITDRKKQKLLLIKKSEDNTHQSYELIVQTRIIDVKIYENAEKIVVIYENGSIQLIDNDQNILTLNPETLGLNEDLVLYNEFITYSNDNLLIQVSISKKKLHYKIISLTNFKFIQINSKIINGDEKSNKKLIFSYNSQYIYQLNPINKTIESINIINFDIEKSISVDCLLSSDSNEIGMSSPSLDRLLLSNANKLYLINFKFNSLLYTFESKSSSSCPNPDEILLKHVIPINGTSLNTSNTFAIYLNLKPKDNNVNVNIINVNVGLNKLNECLGKSIIKPQQKFKGIVNLIEPDFVEQANEFGEELQEVYETLKTASIEQNLQKWERILIPFMKNESWESIKKSINKKSSKKNNLESKTYNFQEFDIDNDRIIDINFIKQVLLLIFQINEEENVEFVNENFVPEYTLIYLLTNPIFPIEFTFGILNLFNETNQEILLRQAIITCPFLSVIELLIQLVNPNISKEIFEDIINRLCNEFSTGEITKKFKQLIISKSINIDLDELLVKLFKLSNNINSIYLIEILIDVGGLFNLTMNTINTLNEFIENKISALMDNSYNLTLTNQALLLCDPKKLKKSKKKSHHDDITTPQSQLSSILSMNNPTNDSNINSTIEISKRIPNYSIEKLII